MGMGSEVKAGFDECNHDVRTLGAPFIGTSEKEGRARRRWVLDEQRCSGHDRHMEEHIFRVIAEQPMLLCQWAGLGVSSFSGESVVLASSQTDLRCCDGPSSRLRLLTRPTS